MLQDPLEPYKLYHARPSDEDPVHPWSPNTAFSGSWYAYFPSVQALARKASRKLLARQELETLWETEEMQTVLCQMAGSTPESSSAAPGASSPALDESRLTCPEYVALITAQVVQNMDAIAWARVNRKARLPELDQHLQEMDKHRQEPTGEQSYEENASSIMSKPGLQRQVGFPFADLQTAFAYAEELGPRSTDFARTLNDFFSAQQMTLAEEPVRLTTAKAKSFWTARAKSLAHVQTACAALRRACEDQDFVGDCIQQQSRIIQEAQKERQQANDEDAELNADWGVALTSLDSVLPQGWIEPAPNSMTPSGYLTKLLSEVSDGHYPTRKQLHVLAVFVEHLDIVKKQEDEGVPWNLRVQLVILLLGQGGCGKTWLVQQFIARVVAYAFCTDEAIRMIAFSKPQATNFPPTDFPRAQYIELAA